MEFWKGRQKEKQKRKQNRKKRYFKDKASQGNKIEKISKISEIAFFGPLYKTKAQKPQRKKLNHKKKQTKNTFLHFGKQPLIFGKLFFKLQTFMSAKMRGPISRDAAILSLRYPILHDIF